MKFGGKYVNTNKEHKAVMEQRVKQSIDSLPKHLKDNIKTDDIIITDKPTSNKKEPWGGGYNKFDDKISINVSSDQDYNNGILTHESAHKDYEYLTTSKQKEFESSEIMSHPITKYNEQVLKKHGDKTEMVGPLGAFKQNIFRSEQYAEINRVLYSKPSKYLADVIVDNSVLSQQTTFFKKLRGVN